MSDDPGSHDIEKVLETFVAGLGDPDEEARSRARDQWNSIAKPIASLGVLEDLVCDIAALTGTTDVRLDRAVTTVLCADNGVVAQGVSQSGPEVTTAVADNVARHASSVCKMCEPVDIDVVAVDMGMLTPAHIPGVIDRCIQRGTGDISLGPAMTREQAVSGIVSGIELVESLKDRGYQIIATGEMSIGNTTTSSAMTSVLLGLAPEEVTGRGAGLSSEGLARKVAAIKRAIAVNDPDPDDAIDVLAKLGGFDIAGLVGIFIGGAVHRVPIVIDGFISMVAALTARRIAPKCAPAMLASHVSSEPAVTALVEELGLRPIIHAGMHLGEGTGAACLVPLLRMALSLYHGTTFDETGIDAYEVDLA